jgi:hypothetical protein
MDRLPRMLTVALAVPPCLALLCALGVGIAERSGGTLFAAPAPANLAEAAGAARADLVVRFLGRGQNPSDVYPIHRDVISSAVLRATALEAAIWSRQLEMIELFDRAGAIPPGSSARRALACLAADLNVDDVVEYLADAGAAPCVPEQALNAVMARTTAAEGR